MSSVDVHWEQFMDTGEAQKTSLRSNLLVSDVSVCSIVFMTTLRIFGCESDKISNDLVRMNPIREGWYADV